MTLDRDVAFTWLGHGTWLVDTPGGKRLLLDAWVKNNPACPEQYTDLDRVDLIAVSHAHFDHIGDAVEIGLKHQPTVICIFEMGTWLQGKGLKNLQAINKGGSVEVDGIRFTMTHAIHSCGIQDGDHVIYGGEACGYVITLENGFRFYFSGDTAVFGDMKLIGDLYQPELALLPIGDYYTMDPRQAALACQLLGVPRVAGMHYGTFPILTGTPAQLREEIGKLGGNTEVLEIAPGESIR